MEAPLQKKANCLIQLKDGKCHALATSSCAMVDSTILDPC